jgi:heme-degrading monooxygenase HmoA
VILEVAILDVRKGQEADFERDFSAASAIIGASAGYVSHRLLHCIEKANRYILLVRWESVEAHTVGFRGSLRYQEWKAALHHYYDPFPTVEHYEIPGAVPDLQ